MVDFLYDRSSAQQKGRILHIRVTQLWAFVLGLLGLFLLTLFLATRSAGAFTWDAMLSAALSTLWWGMLIYLGLVLYRAFKRWRK